MLEGNAGWKGIIKDDAITVWAPCGDKISFKNGKIVSMQLKDKILTYNYQNGQVSEIRDGNAPILKVEKAPITGKVTGLTLPNKEKIQIEHGERPRIQVVNNQQVISGMEKSLSKVTKTDGSALTFDIAVDQELNPTLKIEDRLITWNSATKSITSDGEWTYEIKPSPSKGLNASIGRKNKANKEELWFLDSAMGKEIVQSADGLNKVRSWFVSGVLAGAIRKETETRNGQTKTKYQAFYDERGNLIRETFGDGGNILYHYYNNGTIKTRSIVHENGFNLSMYFDANGNLIEIKRQGKTVSLKCYNKSSGKIESEHDIANGSYTRYSYTKDHIISETEYGAITITRENDFSRTDNYPKNVSIKSNDSQVQIK